jgi:transposase-like protein
MSNQLQEWEVFNKWVIEHSQIKLTVQLPHLNPLNARFRVANSEVEVKGYRDDTGKGYSALLKIVLVWAAFEFFLKMFKLKQRDAGDLIEESEAFDIQKNIRNLDADDKFIKFIKSVVNGQHKKELTDYLNNEPCNIIYLASAIRHAFVHGKLTPNADGTNPDAVSKICNKLSSTLLKMIDDKFSKFVSKLKGPTPD